MKEIRSEVAKATADTTRRKITGASDPQAIIILGLSSDIDSEVGGITLPNIIYTLLCEPTELSIRDAVNRG